MSPTSNRFLTFWKVIGAAGILHLLYFELRLLFSSPALRVQYTPDDGYYYLQLAKSWATSGVWTFDSGVSTTSGFHLLHAYLLAGVYRFLQPDLEGFVRLGVALGGALALVLALLVWKGAAGRRDLFLLILLAFLVTTPNFSYNAVSITEWSWTILLAGAYYAAWRRAARAQEPGTWQSPVLTGPFPASASARGRRVGHEVPCGTASPGSGRPETDPSCRAAATWKEPWKRGAPLLLLAIGFFLSLARSDAGLLPGALFAAGLLYRRRDVAVSSLAGVVGAILGIGAGLAHNWLLTGALLQSSARLKAHWALFSGRPLYGSFSLLASALGLDLQPRAYLRSLILLGTALLAGAVLLLGMGGRGRKMPLSIFRLRDEERPAVPEAIAALLCLCGYLVFFAFNGAPQDWYTADLLVPVAILYVALGRYLQKRILPEKNYAVWWFSLVAVIGIGFNLAALYPLDESRSPWPHQQALQKAGLYLRDNPLNGRVGAWNAGVLGYYQGGQVINLDGLVNNSAVPYVLANSLGDYLEAARIEYLVDLDTMFTPYYMLRGGYTDPAFRENLEPLQTLDDTPYPEWQYLRLYRVKGARAP